MKRIALIPARSGSKRIPYKNIKLFCGEPIIAYSIRVALESRLFDDVIVSTDSEQIAKIASSYGASIPFLRPESLSDDFTPTASVVSHTADILNLDPEDLLCVIYPTAPLLQSSILRDAYEMVRSNPQTQYVFSAVAYDYSPFRSFVITGGVWNGVDGGLDSVGVQKVGDARIKERGTIRMLFPEHYEKRSQDLPQVYHDAGQFYFGRVKAWREEMLIFSFHSKALLLPRHLVQDIDTLEDWAMAEEKYKVLGK